MTRSEKQLKSTQSHVRSQAGHGQQEEKEEEWEQRRQEESDSESGAESRRQPFRPRQANEKRYKYKRQKTPTTE